MSGLKSVTMARGGADSPALPVEVWGRVASFLTLRESCMLASTCRALWAMELLSVTASQGEESECEVLKEGSCPAPGWHCASLLMLRKVQ